MWNGLGFWVMLGHLLSIQQCLRVVGWEDRLSCRDGRAVRCALPLRPFHLPPLPAWLRKSVGASGLLALWNQGLSPSRIKWLNLEVVFLRKWREIQRYGHFLAVLGFRIRKKHLGCPQPCTHMIFLGLCPPLQLTQVCLSSFGYCLLCS